RQHRPGRLASTLAEKRGGSMPGGGGSLIVMVVVVSLSDGTGSVSPLDTCVRLPNRPESEARSTITTDPAPFAGIEPGVQTMVAPFRLQKLGIEVTVAPSGSASTRRTFVAVSGPRFAISTWYEMSCPTWGRVGL